MVSRKKHYAFWSQSGDLFENLKKNLPLDVFDKFHSIYLLYNVEDMMKFEDFQLFRATYKGVEVTFHQYVDLSYSVKVNY